MKTRTSPYRPLPLAPREPTQVFCARCEFIEREAFITPWCALSVVYTSPDPVEGRVKVESQRACAEKNADLHCEDFTPRLSLLYEQARAKETGELVGLPESG